MPCAPEFSYLESASAEAGATDEPGPQRPHPARSPRLPHGTRGFLLHRHLSPVTEHRTNLAKTLSIEKRTPMTEQATGAHHPQPRPRTGGQQPATVEHVTGAQSLIRSLEEVGADTVFGIPGGAILPAYDPMMDSSRRSGTSWSGTSRAPATPPPATRRPPARSASAWRPRAPVPPTWSRRSPTPTWTPCRSSRSPARSPPRPSARTPSRRRTSAASPCRSPSTTSWSPTPTDIPRTIAEAFHIASTGRPGPVLVDIAKDALQAQTTFSWPPQHGPARLPPGDQAARQADPRGRPADHRGQAPGALRRRRRAEGRAPPRS